MIRYHKLKEEGMGRYCTDCVNELFHLELHHSDCLYTKHVHHCEQCGREKHIVVSVKDSAKHKLMRGREPEE